MEKVACGGDLFFEKGKKKAADYRQPAHSANSDRSGEKPYCTFSICIRFHFVNTFFANVLFGV
jgi:hypothetical protein